MFLYDITVLFTVKLMSTKLDIESLAKYNVTTPDRNRNRIIFFLLEKQIFSLV